MVVIGFNHKRGRKERAGDWRNTRLFGQTFPFRRRIKCSETFIKEAGLDNESMRAGVISAINTEHGISITVHDVEDKEHTPVEDPESILKGIQSGSEE